MTIDEAIDYVEDINKTVSWNDEQKQDEDFFNSVADMLEELKELREKDKKLIHLTPKEFDVGTQYTYNKAIDDFMDKLNPCKKCGTCDEKDESYFNVDCINDELVKYTDIVLIAEQLKGGDSSGS